LFLQADQRGIERTHLHLENLGRHLPEALRQTEAVHRFELERFQDQHVERALQQIGFFFVHNFFPSDVRKEKKGTAPSERQQERSSMPILGLGFESFSFSYSFFVLSRSESKSSSENERKSSSTTKHLTTDCTDLHGYRNDSARNSITLLVKDQEFASD
jgi:hypothetical protein